MSVTAQFDYLDDNVLLAAQVCAVPHWLDDQLAVTLLETSGCNGTSQQALQRVKQLPFVFPFEGRGWRIDEDIRLRLLEAIEDSDLFIELSDQLASRFGSQHDNGEAGSRRQERLLQWRAAYHAAAVRPDEAAARLTRLIDQATDDDRPADAQAALDVFELPSMQAYQVELAYAKGREAYARKRFKEAAHRFTVVWNSGRTEQLVWVSGHLLGRIQSRSQAPSARAEAEQTLAQALALAQQGHDFWGQAQILSSIIEAKLTTKHPTKLRQALDLCEEGLALSDLLASGLADRERVRFHILAAQVHVQLGPKHFAGAHAELNAAIPQARKAGLQEALSVGLLTASWLAFSEDKLEDARLALHELLLMQIDWSSNKLWLTVRRLRRALPGGGQTTDGWQVLLSSDMHLVYLRQNALIAVRRGSKNPLLAVPAALHGEWMARTGLTVTLEAQTALAALAEPGAGRVFHRVDR